MRGTGIWRRWVTRLGHTKEHEGHLNMRKKGDAGSTGYTEPGGHVHIEGHGDTDT